MIFSLFLVGEDGFTLSLTNVFDEFSINNIEIFFFNFFLKFLGFVLDV